MQPARLHAGPAGRVFPGGIREGGDRPGASPAHVGQAREECLGEYNEESTIGDLVLQKLQQKYFGYNFILRSPILDNLNFPFTNLNPSWV